MYLFILAEIVLRNISLKLNFKSYLYLNTQTVLSRGIFKSPLSLQDFELAVKQSSLKAALDLATLSGVPAV